MDDEARTALWPDEHCGELSPTQPLQLDPKGVATKQCTDDQAERQGSDLRAVVSAVVVSALVSIQLLYERHSIVRASYTRRDL